MRALFAATAANALWANRREDAEERRMRAGANPKRRDAGRARAILAAAIALLVLGAGLGESVAHAAISRKDKKVIRTIVNAEVTKRAPELSVAQAGSAAVAGTADHATRADAAASANHASAADHAASADHATSADQLSCSSPVPGTGEMVRVGSFCIDRYEASVWSRPDGGTQLTTEAQLDAACPDSGQPQGSADCANFYARSVPGVQPTQKITWFQAQQALANSGRRLPENAEWQEAVSGTPDAGQCVVSSTSVVITGSQTTCVSRFGSFDMVGNVNEWVADWVPAPTDCPSWSAFSDDLMCLAGASTSVHGPAALFRGGYNADGSAGPFAVAGLAPQNSALALGFRGAR